MNAESLLIRIAEALTEARLEAVMIGNAAAALNGAPVTTVDFDFMVRDTQQALGRIREFARALNAEVVPPRTDVSRVYSVVNEQDGLFVDFLDTVTGVSSYASLRSRAEAVRFGVGTLRVASLRDVLASKRAANRPKDRAVIELIELTLGEADAKGRGAP
jgi:hypothetical protein